MGSMSKGRNARKYARAHPGVFLVTLGIVLHPVAARAGVEGDLELLQRTAMMIRENRDKIRYWQGSATINVDEKDRQGAWLRQEKRSASFWLSRDLDAVRWSMSIDSLKSPDAAGRLVEAQGVLRRTDEMKKGQTFYRYRDYYITREGENKKGLNIYPLERADRAAYSTTFDPMWYFTLKGLDMTDRLMFFFHEARNPEIMPTKVWQEGRLVILEIDSERVLSRHVFDLERGGNLIEYTGKEYNVGSERRTWAYEQQGGAWVPKEFLFVHEQSVADASEWAWRDFRVTFAGNVVNQPIDPCEFTLESLGVKLGDRVSDTTLKLSYSYEGEEANKSSIPPDVTFTDAKSVKPSLNDKAPGPHPGSAPGTSPGSRLDSRAVAEESADPGTPASRGVPKMILVSALLLVLAIGGILAARRYAGSKR
jgi:hypothetical protein